MAVVNTVLGSTLQRTVFTKPPDAQRQYTPIPRAVVNAFIIEGVLDAKPVNDTQELQIAVVLDPKFVYQLVDFNVSAIQDVANDWNVRGYIEIQNGIRNLPAGMTTRWSVPLDDTRQNVTATEVWIARGINFEGMPRFLIQARPGQLAIFNFFAHNPTAAVGAAGVIDSYFSFFEYEIEQAQYFALHYGATVYTR